MVSHNWVLQVTYTIFHSLNTLWFTLVFVECISLQLITAVNTVKYPSYWRKFICHWKACEQSNFIGSKVIAITKISQILISDGHLKNKWGRLNKRGYVKMTCLSNNPYITASRAYRALTIPFSVLVFTHDHIVSQYHIAEGSYV